MILNENKEEKDNNNNNDNASYKKKNKQLPLNYLENLYYEIRRLAQNGKPLVRTLWWSIEYRGHGILTLMDRLCLDF